MVLPLAGQAGGGDLLLWVKLSQLDSEEISCWACVSDQLEELLAFE